MVRVIITAIIISLPGLFAGAQSFTSSNLPIVVISTDGGYSIPDNSRITGTMKIIDRGAGQRNFLSDQNVLSNLNFSGRIEIEIRGSSSQASAKKQYGFSTLKSDDINKDNVSLLGMPAENDWILNGMSWDPGMIRDYMCFNLSRQLGEYASRCEYCEVVINGSYRGLYLLAEKIKSDDNRVDIIKMNPGDDTFPGLTGGYITKADKTNGSDPVAWTMASWYGGSVDFIHHQPEPEEITIAQNSYIRNWFTKLASTAQSGDISLNNGYPSVIDIPSFINYIIICELSSNPDAYRYSTYFHKDRNGKLRAGPVWDSDLTFGNDLFIFDYDRSKTDVWQFSDGGNDGARFWRDLFLNSRFRCYLSKRWNELIRPGYPLDINLLETFIDQTVAMTGEAVARDYQKWGVTGNHADGISALKAWLNERIAWITDNLGTYAECSNVPVPPLVISKIMFNPPASIWFPDGEELEFIEITNNGSNEVDLSGIYFAGTGLVYQFPYKATMAPDTSYYLAANTGVFYNKYGLQPYGQFTRHISNSGQDLILSDAFGNEIDRVRFSDTLPWPEADGNGSYLKLTDPGLDNNFPGSWTATNDLLLSDQSPDEEKGPALFPNPVSDKLRIRSERTIQAIGLFDISGRSIADIRVDDTVCDMNLANLPAGLYILRINISGKIFSEKIIRY